MIRYLAATGLLLGAALVQSVIGPRLPFLGSRPDFPLVLVVAWAMLRGSGEGAAIGFIGGSLLDYTASTPPGLNAALLGVIGYTTGLGETNLYRGSVPFFLAAGIGATLAFHTARLFALQAMGLAMGLVVETYRVAIPAAFMNALLLVPAFLLCRRLLRALDGWRQLRL